jgi:protocatechuate 3,4-dioxygenase beta subunit
MHDDRETALDLTRHMHRRNVLKLIATSSVVALAGCASSKLSTSSGTTAATGTTGSTGTTGATDLSTLTRIPEETGGPFPADGSNGPNVLSESGVVRRDITKSFGSASGTADGVPTTIKLTLLDTGNDNAPLAGAAVYVWHCDREGRYSQYNEIADENYLRGVQSADADGVVTFASIFPAAYSGRWPHIHFEVFASEADATDGGQKLVTSQIALPEAVCTTVFESDGYEQSVQNMNQTSLENDNVFGDDDGVHELATVTGDASNYTIALAVAV